MTVGYRVFRSSERFDGNIGLEHFFRSPSHMGIRFCDGPEKMTRQYTNIEVNRLALNHAISGIALCEDPEGQTYALPYKPLSGELHWAIDGLYLKKNSMKDNG